MTGLGAHYELVVNCRGRVSEVPGYLINIKEIDQVVRAVAVPEIQRRLHTGGAQPGEILPDLMSSMREPLRGLLTSMRWMLTPYYSAEMTIAAPTTVLIRQKFDFCAAHRLHVASLSDEENRRLFGKCNYPGGHGHNYQLEPCIAVSLDSTGKQRFVVQELERLADDLIVQRFDHKNLNQDTTEFRDGSGLNPSVENIARVCFELLVGAVSSANPAARLQSVTVWESDRTSCTYPG